MGKGDYQDKNGTANQYLDKQVGKLLNGTIDKLNVIMLELTITKPPFSRSEALVKTRVKKWLAVYEENGLRLFGNMLVINNSSEGDTDDEEHDEGLRKPSEEELRKAEEED